MKFIFCPKEIHHFREISETLFKHEKIFYEKCLTHTELFDLQLKPFKDVVEDVSYSVMSLDDKYILTIKFTLKS